MKKGLLITLIVALFQLLYSQELIPLTEEMRQAFLDAHNKYRAEVGVPPLKWSEELEQYAQKWALFMAKTQSFKHSPTQDYGENIFKATYLPTPKDVVDAWAEEAKYYHGETIQLDNYWIFGHYTQIIWSKTTELGCAIAKDAKGTYYVVCEYKPAGNIIGQKPVQ